MNRPTALDGADGPVKYPIKSTIRCPPLEEATRKERLAIGMIVVVARVEPKSDTFNDDVCGTAPDAHAVK